MGGYRPGWLNGAVAWATVIYLILPITIILPVSLTDQRFLSLPVHALSGEHYLRLLTTPAWTNAILQSAFIAVASTVLAVVLGTLCAIGCWRLSRRSTELVRALMLLPIIIPSIAYAIGLYRYFAKLGLLDSFTGVVIAHGVTGIPYVVITVSTALAAFDPRLESAARGMGASLPQTLRWVILPRIAPGIVSGAIFAFIHSWDELVVVLFIASRRVFTLPRKIWDGINENLDPAMAAVAVLLVAMTVLLLLLDLALRRQRRD
ncbi:putative spermidine/putrescine transport system permease protein [Roseomonas rosea]|uniref:Putative spermidine/putrescine transport system permease protein n=1 Tax=Muricoccus roseus TaxID=198092 RepID=A0A1M6E5I9_9PROT|nr:ABC transporter permease [Roseomonas rosea]SHI80711.1 putative spermidine/putrescine transport system permease protein [Roseomonas rosea]